MKSSLYHEMPQVYIHESKVAPIISTIMTVLCKNRIPGNCHSGFWLKENCGANSTPTLIWVDMKWYAMETVFLAETIMLADALSRMFLEKQKNGRQHCPISSSFEAKKSLVLTYNLYSFFRALRVVVLGHHTNQKTGVDTHSCQRPHDNGWSAMLLAERTIRMTEGWHNYPALM